MKAIIAILCLVPGVLLGAFTEHDNVAIVLCVAAGALAVWHLIVRDRKGGV